MAELKFKRVLLKIGGEALAGPEGFGIDPQRVAWVAEKVRSLRELGAEVVLVLGAGNIWRGKDGLAHGMERSAADHMGMLATVMNALAMQDALEQRGVPARVMSALRLERICEEYDRRRALRHLERGRVVLFAAGTGNPLFTTDTAASLRAIEIGADLLIKATKVAGIYSADPLIHPEARFYPRLTYEQVLRERLAVMDTTAMVLCRDHRLPVRVLNIHEPEVLARVTAGEDLGSLVDHESSAAPVHQDGQHAALFAPRD